MKRLLKIATLLLLVSCSGHGQFGFESSLRHADWIDVRDSLVISISPFDGSTDTLIVGTPLQSVVCMSSTYSAGFAEIGAADRVSGISGRRYLSNEYIRSHAAEIGSDAALDYETVLALQPDVVLVYGISAATPAYIDRLEELGIRTFRLYDHLEGSPLGRAEYIRAYGAMAGLPEVADSVFCSIEEAYESIRTGSDAPVKVLMNSPYGDAWYIPGADSYMATLVRDAGGEILGCKPGIESSIISIEDAFLLSQNADIWLNPGRGTRPSVIQLDRVYDNSLLTTPEGGNDFWERGAVRPDLVLSDLRGIFSGSDGEMNYYLRLD